MSAAVIDTLIDEAHALADFVWQAYLAEGPLLTPESKAALWARLGGLAATIVDPETREQYLADWRGRFDEAFPPPPAWARDFETLPHGHPSALSEQAEAVQAVLRSDTDAWLGRKVEQWSTRPPTRDHLLRAAFKGGRRVGAGLLTREALVNGLMPHVERIDGLESSDVDKPIDRGIGRPWDIGPDVQTLRCRSYPMTDFGIAEMFVALHGQDFANTTAKGWLGWDGRRWKVLDQDKDGPPPAELQAAIIDTIRRYQDIARLVRASGVQSDDNPDGLDRWIPRGKGQELLSAAIARFGRASETAGKPTSIAKLVQRWLTRPIEDFDRDPFAVNVMNGTLKFRRQEFDGRTSAALELCSHDRADMITHLAPAAYDPSAESPVFDEFFEWAHPSAPVRRYLSQVFGYTMTGDTGEQKLWFHYGKGGNGKSVFFDIIAFVLGDYAGSIGIETFLDQGIKKRGDAATPDLARLGGVRFLRTSEPERGARLNEALIKAATGGEPMPVRALHRGFFDLTPAFKPHIAGNYRPDIPGTDEGIWRRMKLVPWGEHRAENARDPHLVDKMKREGAGVLRWMVGGLLDWLENGLVEPDAVKVATEAYRDDTDPLGQFIAMCLEPAPGERVQSSVLHEVYSAWCQSAGERIWKPNGFADAMRERGFEKKKSNGIKWLDIRLKRSVDDFIDPDGRVRLLQDDQDHPAETPFSDEDDDYVPGFD